LTTLPNRALLQDRLTQAILTGHRENTPVAFILMDLDRFKDINNTLGHHHGDLLLRQIGPRIQKLLRESDTIARLGGDEFAILLPDTDGEGARQVVAKLEKTLEAPFAIDGLTVTVEASIGIALYPEHGSKAETLIQRADVAMYTAKHGGGGHAVYSPEHDQYSPGRLALMGELRDAIEHDELVLHYQPKIHLPTSRVIGVEALVRWQHPHRGLMPPDEFVPLAEQTGLIKPLTLGVITAALRQLQIWRGDGLRLNMAVNLSARNLQDPQLPDQVAELLQNAGALPEHLELEITESTIMADPARALDILTRLNRMGLVLTIDDFGTGYSSLGYLKRLPVSAIKIDKSFVRNMAEDDNDAVIVRSTIELAQNLGLTVVAEGVETQYILDRLAALGCDAAQGYYMSRPMPADALTRWFHESPWQVTKVVDDDSKAA
jgi:diguanylate cyclase (GGDEF)-like protein